MAGGVVIFSVLLTLVSSSSLLSAQSLHQDICAAAPNSPVQVNGFDCKEIKAVEVNDFFVSGLDKPGALNRYGSAVVPVTVNQVPGLNSVGLSVVRADYVPGGIFPPHINHVSEIVTVTEGSLEVGFVTGYPDQRLLSKVLQKGDAFVIPEGLIHYQKNVGTVNASAIVALSGQNISPVLIANTVFGSAPKIASDILEKSFRVDKTIIGQIQAKFD